MANLLCRSQFRQCRQLLFQLPFLLELLSSTISSPQIANASHVLIDHPELISCRHQGHTIRAKVITGMISLFLGKARPLIANAAIVRQLPVFNGAMRSFQCR
jgi:hypothetical protein